MTTDNYLDDEDDDDFEPIPGLALLAEAVLRIEEMAGLSAGTSAGEWDRRVQPKLKAKTLRAEAVRIADLDIRFGILPAASDQPRNRHPQPVCSRSNASSSACRACT